MLFPGNFELRVKYRDNSLLPPESQRINEAASTGCSHHCVTFIGNFRSKWRLL